MFFQESLRTCAMDKRSRSIGRVKFNYKPFSTLEEPWTRLIVFTVISLDNTSRKIAAPERNKMSLLVSYWSSSLIEKAVHSGQGGILYNLSGAIRSQMPLLDFQHPGLWWTKRRYKV